MGKEGGLKTSKYVRTCFMDDPIEHGMKLESSPQLVFLQWGNWYRKTTNTFWLRGIEE